MPSWQTCSSERKIAMAVRALPVTSFCFLFLGVAYLAGSLDLPMGSADRPGAGLYPFLLGIFLVSISLPLFLGSLRVRKPQKEKEEEEPFPQGKDLQRVVAVSVTLTFFVVLLKPLGYGICSAVLMGSILRLLGLRSWIKIVLISIACSVISYYLFASILDVPLPRGIFFF